MLTLIINGTSHTLDLDPEEPLLWVLREKLGLTGTKFGCGSGHCGSCTVLIDNQPLRSCTTPVGLVAEKEITTIEGIPANHPIIASWQEEQVAQCGYCQSGQIITSVALLEKNPQPNDADIDRALATNLCRCGTYQRIRRAIHRAAQRLGGEKS